MKSFPNPNRRGRMLRRRRGCSMQNCGVAPSCIALNFKSNWGFFFFTTSIHHASQPVAFPNQSWNKAEGGVSSTSVFLYIFQSGNIGPHSRFVWIIKGRKPKGQGFWQANHFFFCQVFSEEKKLNLPSKEAVCTWILPLFYLSDILFQSRFASL